MERYQTAIRDSSSRGCEEVLRDFEKAVGTSHAVINRPLLEVERLATSDKELYATYYQLIEGGLKIPTGAKWDILRGVSDNALFPTYKEHVRFGALSLSGLGLSSYGECSLVVNGDMISHRASVFEENSVMFMATHGVKIAEADSLPKGYRATWNDRSKLAAIKVADEINENTQPDEYPDLLLREGATSADDKFVEVHIFGPMTVRTLRRVIVKRPNRRPGRVILRALIERLKKVGVSVEEMS